MTGRPVVIALASLTCVMTFVAGCRGREAEPQDAAARLKRGRDLVERMSSTLGGSPAFSVTTHEVRERVDAQGRQQRRTLTRDSVVRRPDRLYFKTSGDAENEGFYDGKGLTLVMHRDKVFAQARMPETLDRTMDAITERYGIPMPLGDFVYSSPAKALLSRTTSGGWVGREDAGGTQTDHLAFKDTGISWELWLPTSGQPLPRRLKATIEAPRGANHIDVTFSRWNLSPQSPDRLFVPRVPPDYEGIALIQRAAILRHARPADSVAQPPGPVGSKPSERPDAPSPKRK